MKQPAVALRALAGEGDTRRRAANWFGWNETTRRRAARFGG